MSFYVDDARWLEYTYPVFQGQGQHLIWCGRPSQARAQCFCGWKGPDRTGEMQYARLLLDDVCAHCHNEVIRCPRWEECDRCARLWRATRTDGIEL